MPVSLHRRILGAARFADDTDLVPGVTSANRLITTALDGNCSPNWNENTTTAGHSKTRAVDCRAAEPRAGERSLPGPKEWRIRLSIEVRLTVMSDIRRAVDD